MHAVQSVERVVEAVPAHLGFVPEESIVVVMVANGAAQAMLRVDLADVRDTDAAESVERLGWRAMQGGVDGAVVVAVSADGARCPMCAEGVGEFVAAFEAVLVRRGGELFGAVMVDRIAAGGRWHCVDKCGRGGVLADPAASVEALAATVAGRRMYGSREELAASVAADMERRSSVGPLLNGVGRAVDCVAVAVRGVVTLMRRMAAGAVLSDAELASAGARLRDARVRDALCALSGSEEAAAAEALWTVLARVLPPPFRVEALSLLAASAYRRADGPLAGVALEAALCESPEHRLSGLLDTALQSGVQPDEIAKVLDAGAVAAA